MDFIQLRTFLLAVPLPITATMATICWATPGCCAWTMGAGTPFHHLVLVRHAIRVATWAGDPALVLWHSVWEGFHSEIVKADQTLIKDAPKYSDF